MSGVQGDVANPADLDRLYETIAKVKGRLDIVFANAGLAEFVLFGAITEEHFDKLFNINVRGTLFTVQKTLPLLKDGGSIILNGSVASVKGTAGYPVSSRGPRWRQVEDKSLRLQCRCTSSIRCARCCLPGW